MDLIEFRDVYDPVMIAKIAFYYRLYLLHLWTLGVRGKVPRLRPLQKIDEKSKKFKTFWNIKPFMVLHK